LPFQTALRSSGKATPKHRRLLEGHIHRCFEFGLEAFRDAGFILKEDIIKLQHNTKTTREKWKGKYDFYKIAHEHLFVFRKSNTSEKIAQFKSSTRWPNPDFIEDLVVPDSDN
jgi:hypothetical protein